MTVVELPVRRLHWSPEDDPASSFAREWLLTNGLGGYSCGTVGGLLTRRYHGLLVAAHPAPLGRIMTLVQSTERIRRAGRDYRLTGEDRGGSVDLGDVRDGLQSFELHGGLPVWRHHVGGVVVEKRVVLLHLQNTVHISYKMIEGDGAVRLSVMPWIHFRSHDADVDSPAADPLTVRSWIDHHEISSTDSWPTLRLRMSGEKQAFRLEPHSADDLNFRIESDRGYISRGPLASPGFFRVDLRPGADAAVLVASTESWETIRAISPSGAFDNEMERRRRLLSLPKPKVAEGLGAELVLAADQFVIRPATRLEDAARAHALGDEARTIIAGYHWFTDWGRDTMISLEGLTLTTGRAAGGGLHYFARLATMFATG